MKIIKCLSPFVFTWALACSGGNSFQDGAQKKSPDAQSSKEKDSANASSKKDLGDGSAANANGDSKFTLKIAPGDKDSTGKKTTVKPLSVYFALDVTGSMRAVLDGIKESIVDFAAKLREGGLEPSLGVVTFADRVVGKLPLTSAETDFKTFISSQSTIDGGDLNEASLLAVKTALQDIQAQSKPDALKAILVITDNPGHWGDTGGGTVPSPQRDCRVNQLVDQLNQLSDDEQHLIRIYHSTGSNGFGTVAACGGYQTAEAQWNDVLSQGLIKSGPNMRGSKVPYPFSGDTLTNDFAKLLIKANQVCLASEVTLKDKDQELSKWKFPGFPEVYKSWQNGEALEWKNPLDGVDPASFKKDEASLTIKRCCFDMEKADAGDFQNCEESTDTMPLTNAIQ